MVGGGEDGAPGAGARGMRSDLLTRRPADRRPRRGPDLQAPVKPRAPHAFGDDPVRRGERVPALVTLARAIPNPGRRGSRPGRCRGRREGLSRTRWALALCLGAGALCVALVASYQPPPAPPGLPPSPGAGWAGRSPHSAWRFADDGATAVLDGGSDGGEFLLGAAPRKPGRRYYEVAYRTAGLPVQLLGLGPALALHLRPDREGSLLCGGFPVSTAVPAAGEAGVIGIAVDDVKGTVGVVLNGRWIVPPGTDCGPDALDKSRRPFARGFGAGQTFTLRTLGGFVVSPPSGYLPWE